MTILFTKNYLLPFLLLNFSIIAMEKPKNYQQLQNTMENMTPITYYGMITDDSKYLPILNSPIKYVTQSVLTQLNLSSTIYDPVITFNIVDDASNIKFKK